MAMNVSTTDQMVSPAQVWTHLSLDLQGPVVRLLAQLAAHLVLTEEERAHPTRKEAFDALPSITQQDPARPSGEKRGDLRAAIVIDPSAR